MSLLFFLQRSSLNVLLLAPLYYSFPIVYEFVFSLVGWLAVVWNSHE